MVAAPPPSTLPKPLVVMIVFFGQLPPWLPLTLHSMAANERVAFVVVGDAPAPAVLPPNVHFEHISYGAMQERLSALAGRPVRYTNTYKANDIKPLLPCAAVVPRGEYRHMPCARGCQSVSPRSAPAPLHTAGSSFHCSSRATSGGHGPT